MCRCPVGEGANRVTTGEAGVVGTEAMDRKVSGTVSPSTRRAVGRPSRATASAQHRPGPGESAWPATCGIGRSMRFVRDNPGQGGLPPRRSVLQLAEESAAPVSPEVEAAAEVVAVRRAVAMENHLARDLAQTSPYEQLAKEAIDSIQGGRAAVLPPEVRRRLVAGAVRTGMRPFEAHLVLAAVQDAARHGEVQPPRHRERATSAARHERLAQRVMLAVVLVVVLASAIFVGLVAWIVSGPTSVERAGAAWPPPQDGASSGTPASK